MLCSLMTVPHGFSDSRPFVAASLSRSMQGNVYLEFVVFQINYQSGMRPNTDWEKINEKILT